MKGMVFNRPFTLLIIILIIGGLLRLTLPYVLLNYVNKTLNKIPDYQAHIDDLNLCLLSGGYIIKGISINKINHHIPVPYFSAPEIFLKLQWKALFHGHAVGEIVLQHPQINFVIDRKGNNQQLTIDSSWQDRVKELYPFKFNQIVIINGEIHLRNFTSKNPYDLYIKNVQAEATNLSNIAQHKKLLPASIIASGNTLDGAEVQANIQFDPIAQQPTFDLDTTIKNMNITAANPILRDYTHVDVKRGWFSLYIEAAAAHGKITGYVKPLLVNLQIINPNEHLSPPQLLYKMVVTGVAKILQNPSTKAVATKIIISGNINNLNMSIWSLIISLLKNAFIQALLPQIDNSVQISSISVGNNSQ